MKSILCPATLTMLLLAVETAPAQAPIARDRLAILERVLAGERAEQKLRALTDAFYQRRELKAALRLGRSLLRDQPAQRSLREEASTILHLITRCSDHQGEPRRILIEGWQPRELLPGSRLTERLPDEYQTSVWPRIEQRKRVALERIAEEYPESSLGPWARYQLALRDRSLKSLERAQAFRAILKKSPRALLAMHDHERHEAAGQPLAPALRLEIMRSLEWTEPRSLAREATMQLLRLHPAAMDAEGRPFAAEALRFLLRYSQRNDADHAQEAMEVIRLTLDQYPDLRYDGGHTHPDALLAAAKLDPSKKNLIRSARLILSRYAGLWTGKPHSCDKGLYADMAMDLLRRAQPDPLQRLATSQALLADVDNPTGAVFLLHEIAGTAKQLGRIRTRRRALETILRRYPRVVTCYDCEPASESIRRELARIDQGEPPMQAPR